MTWQELVDKVAVVLDMLGVAPGEVDIRYIDVLGSEGVRAIEVLKRADGRHEMFIE